MLSTFKSAYTVLMYALHLTGLFEGVLHTTSTGNAVSQLLLLRGAVSL